ncbi:hypothetical protein WICPIJ_003671 [Wickerhamomyces pijperi]|uniref:Uncharacterized protein n=1 Tax=Wickerhamomyces pijperi TaxID=599730 RepID=A0A9P8Q7F5_WICPI|nr:hypothetical protein WICPIJ_003671 [Wickerhamomyces pijperi]
MFSLKSNVKSLESSPCLILSIKSDCDCRYSKYSSLDKSRPGSSIVDLYELKNSFKFLNFGDVTWDG